jgi:hypothetical protein
MTIMRVAFVVLMLAVARDADACQCMESGPFAITEAPAPLEIVVARAP